MVLEPDTSSVGEINVVDLQHQEDSETERT